MSFDADIINIFEIAEVLCYDFESAKINCFSYLSVPQCISLATEQDVHKDQKGFSI